jgi:hypothetical protein
MTRCDWIVCERTNRWAPALRIALPRSGPDYVSVSEVRSLAELSERIEETTNFVALVEVTRANLDAVLSWLATNSHGNNGAIIAAVDHDLSISAVSAALREAGAIDVFNSPRRLQSAIRLGGLAHAEATHHSRSSKPQVGQSLEAWARSLLPWQAAR